MALDMKNAGLLDPATASAGRANLGAQQQLTAALIAALPFGASNTIASAGTTDLSTVASLAASVTGTATITSFGTTPNILRLLSFAAAATLTHDAVSLILPGAANITTAAGDAAIARSDGSGHWTVLAYFHAVVAGLGYTPANKAGDTFGGAVTVASGGAFPSGKNIALALNLYASALALAAPASSGSADTAVLERRQFGNVSQDYGALSSLVTWMQNRLVTDFTTTYGHVINPLGGNVGINTGAATPAYPLDVNGRIRSQSGGFQFPDGTTQASAGVQDMRLGSATTTGGVGLVLTTVTVSGGTAYIDNNSVLQSTAASSSSTYKPVQKNIAGTWYTITG